MRSIFAGFMTIAALHFAGFSEASAQKLSDGPYVFYAPGKLYYEAVQNGTVQRDSLTVKDRAGLLLLKVPVHGKPFPAFVVPLKKQLNNEASEFDQPSRMLVLSDIEGTFDGFTQMLRAAGVIDAQLNWSFNDGHLVICGDVFDRGDEVTACLWLLYKLEEEAKSKGGYVHVILGNHEIMNLSEDLRYVHPKYPQVATLLGRTYMDFYSPESELGKWLRTKNIIEKVGSWLFTHGGISQEVNDAGHSLKKINSRVRGVYDKDGYDSVLQEAKAVLYFNSNTSPFWYRGYFAAPLATQAQVDSTLRLYQVQHIVVGHTIVESIRSLYNGKVIAIDVNHHTSGYQALYIEGDRFCKMLPDGTKETLQ
jgi:hypothetical protein